LGGKNKGKYWDVERPIILKAHEVRGIIDGRQTQLRRIIKSQAPLASYVGLDLSTKPGEGIPTWCMHDGKSPEHRMVHCPFGQVGDRLWGRETWKYYDWCEDGQPKIAFAADDATCWPDVPEEWQERVFNIWGELSVPENYDIDHMASDRGWRPSTQMPRWASRILLEIVSVRVERLCGISHEDAVCEGVVPSEKEGYAWQVPYNGGLIHTTTAAKAFAWLWRDIHGEESWDANPFVWVVEFKRVDAA
jgi:hypothetical protein